MRLLALTGIIVWAISFSGSSVSMLSNSATLSEDMYRRCWRKSNLTLVIGSIIDLLCSVMLSVRRDFLKRIVELRGTFQVSFCPPSPPSLTPISPSLHLGGMWGRMRKSLQHSYHDRVGTSPDVGMVTITTSVGWMRECTLRNSESMSTRTRTHTVCTVVSGNFFHMPALYVHVQYIAACGSTR